MSNETNEGLANSTNKQQDTETLNHTKHQANIKTFVFKFGIGFILISFIVILAQLQLNLFWKILIAFTAIYTAGEMNTIHHSLVWHWPKIIKLIGYLLLATTLAQSGVKQWTESVVDKTDEWFSCQAKPEQAKCLKEEKVVAQNYIPTQPQVITMPKETEVKPPLKAHAEPCTDKWHKDLDGCQEVTFQGDAVYIREDRTGKCLVWDLGSSIDDIHINDKHIFSLKPEYQNMRAIMVRFSYVPFGVNYKGYLCKK